MNVLFAQNCAFIVVHLVTENMSEGSGKGCTKCDSRSHIMC
jgi:hypothetical protein